MKMKSKKLISLILAVVLVLGVFPMAGFATGEEGPVNETPAITQTSGESTTTPAGSDETATPAGSDETVTPAGSDETVTPPPVGEETATPAGTDETVTPSPDASSLPATPTPAPTPTPTPEAVVLADLSGNELYAYLLTLSGDELKAALEELSQEQIGSLKPYLSEEENTTWFANPLTEEVQPGVDMTNAGPFMPPVIGAAKRSLLRSFAAPMAVNATADADGLETSKTVSYNGSTDDYKIRLEAWTTGAVSNEITAIPTDFVLVLDQSGSMTDRDNDFISYEYTAVLGSQYDWHDTNYYGFEDYRGEYYIQLDDGTYQQVTYADDDNNENDYYRYGSGSNRVYVYPKLIDTYNSRTRQHSYAIKQFYTSEQIRTSRLQALKDAVTQFISDVKVNSEENNNVNHRIAMVGFASGQRYWDGWNSTWVYEDYNNTELFDGSTVYTYNAGSVNSSSNPNSAQSHYADAFQHVNDAGDYAKLGATIGQLSGSGGTMTDLGMEMANGVLTATPLAAGEQRNRVVILFTDGEPGWFGYDTDYANLALTQAKAIKNDRGATLYSIGVFSGADPAGTSDVNKFMNYVSSNYKNAQSMSNPGSRTGNGYYLAASSAEALNEAFENISDQISTPDLSLGTGAMIKDFVTEYFDASNATVTVKTAAYNGSAFSSTETPLAGVTTSVNGNVVTVTGYNFDANFISSTPRNGSYYGQKLIIEFNVTRADGFIGGNDVPTNAAGSGVYENSSSGSPLEDFAPPVANVEILYNSFSTQHRNIFAGDDVALTGLFGNTYVIGGQTYTLGGSVTNQYADVAFTVKDASNNTVGVYTIPAGYSAGSWNTGFSGTIQDVLNDTTYSVSATVTPSDDSPSTNIGTAGTATVNAGNANINVFKPVITANDLSVYLTQNPTVAQLNSLAQNVTWKRGAQVYSDAGLSNPPTLSYTYTGIPAEYATADTGIGIASVTRADGVAVTSVATINKTASAISSDSGDLTLFILKPVITCSDTTVFLGDATDLDDRISTTIGWTGTTGAPGVAAPFLTAPTFTLAPIYIAGTDPTGNGGKDAFAPLVDSDFKVQLLFGSTDLTQFCIVKNGTADVTSDDHHFTVLVVCGQLTINKSVEGALNDECFLFTITVDPVNGSDYSFREVIEGNGSKVITGLPKGTYSVSEDTNWSWHYNTTDIDWTDTYGNDQQLGETNADTTMVCNVSNSSRTPFWLSDDTLAVNRFAPYAG